MKPLSTGRAVRRRLRQAASPAKAKILARFFKTGPGEYGEGDRFLGVQVPDSRRVAKAARDLPQKEIAQLISSPVHEERVVALLILADQFQRAKTGRAKYAIYRFYVKCLRWVNNWDLVDGSAPIIVGGYLMDRSKRPLYRWARSRSLWERRVAILATQHFIRDGKHADTLRIARILLRDREDLIHKAVGWMLREVGTRDRAAEEKFLRAHCRRMPRTMLRYAIEHFPESKRRAFLAGRV